MTLSKVHPSTRLSIYFEPPMNDDRVAWTTGLVDDRRRWRWCHQEDSESLSPMTDIERQLRVPTRLPTVGSSHKGPPGYDTIAQRCDCLDGGTARAGFSSRFVSRCIKFSTWACDGGTQTRTEALTRPRYLDAITGPKLYPGRTFF